MDLQEVSSKTADSILGLIVEKFGCIHNYQKEMNIKTKRSIYDILFVGSDLTGTNVGTKGGVIFKLNELRK